MRSALFAFSLLKTSVMYHHTHVSKQKYLITWKQTNLFHEIYVKPPKLPDKISACFRKCCKDINRIVTGK